MSGKSWPSDSTTIPTGNGSEPAWLKINDYTAAGGWTNPGQGAERARWCCEQLEEGRILYFDGIPYDFPEADRRFLLEQR